MRSKSECIFDTGWENSKEVPWLGFDASSFFFHDFFLSCFVFSLCMMYFSSSTVGLNTSVQFFQYKKIPNTKQRKQKQKRKCYTTTMYVLQLEKKKPHKKIAGEYIKVVDE